LQKDNSRQGNVLKSTMVDDKDETSATFVSYSRDDDPIILNSSNNSDNIDYNLHSQPPLSIYWGGCAFGSAFCKYTV